MANLLGEEGMNYSDNLGGGERQSPIRQCCWAIYDGRRRIEGVIYLGEGDDEGGRKEALLLIKFAIYYTN
jgi:hypothetical protein